MIYYIARDKDGELYMYENCPVRDIGDMWVDLKSSSPPFRLNKSSFLNVTWYSEPIKVEVKEVVQ